MPFAIGHALNQTRGSAALLVAPGASQWAEELLPRLSAGFRSARQLVAPVRIGWETATSREAIGVAERVCPIDGEAAIALTIALSKISNPPGWIQAAVNSIDLNRRAHGKVSWTRPELTALFEKKASTHRAFGRQKHHGIPVMSIHAAKNRQFRNVIILWPPGVQGSDDHQRRLLYNAITRAEHEATVFVRTEALLRSPPFA
jgi:hypothetical protein